MQWNCKTLVTLALAVIIPPAIMLPAAFGIYKLGWHVAHHKYLIQQVATLHNENQELHQANHQLGAELSRLDWDAYLRITLDPESTDFSR